MEHPLQNPSLTPAGYVFLLYRARAFEVLPNSGVNGDRVAADFWEERHRLRAEGTLPAETILHDILPTLGNHVLQLADIEFRGRRYVARDIMILSTCMQWFGTNVGNCFLTETPFRFTPNNPCTEFVERFALMWKTERIDLRRRLLHECNSHCGEPALTAIPQSLVGKHDFSRTDITSHDRRVIEALLLWLGSIEGRAYTREYLAYRKDLIDAHWKERKAVLLHA